MALLKWLRQMAGTEPDLGKPVREAAMRRASREHTKGAGDLIKAARDTLSARIDRDLHEHREGHAD